MVSVLALVLIVVAALAVDLGNAWARGRIVQKQADVSAVGAGSLLPMSISDARTDNEPEDVAARAAALLNGNTASGQPVVDADDLLDGARENGEIVFQNASGVPCTDNCVRMELVAPAAEVDFGLAGAVASGVAVSRSATVEVFSELPPKEKVIPLWVPSGCGYGPIDGDTTQGGSATAATTSATSSPTASPTAGSTQQPSPTATASAAAEAITPRGDHVLTGPAIISVPAGTTAPIEGYAIGNLANNLQKASIRLVAPDGSRFIDYATSTDVPKQSMTVPTFDVGTEVTSTPGAWHAYAMVQANGSGKALVYSSTDLIVDVTGTPPPSAPASTDTAPSAQTTATTTAVPVGCAGQDRGNFGQLDSPRQDGGAGNNSRLSWNAAFGLDHVLMPFDTTAYEPQKECARANGSDPIPGSQLDEVSMDGNNCIKGDTGNDGPGLYKGFIDGVDNRPGRLDVRRGGSNCTGDTRIVGGRTINDDRLDCFLRSGATLDQIAQATGVDDSMLDASVKDSPRFVWLPMVLATDRAQKGYQPIIDYVPAFLTDQTQTAGPTEDNGLQINGNSLKAIRFFAFNKAALPIGERAPSTDYSSALARPIVRLVG
ncbi:hypothetical protein [Nocardioides deserti]|uniref:Flp pilus-assembly TadG-like N-terminal domain-containing protein n=1 Tax=Nocardioides deserti TaxID=1588644 RepID=A0ABR6UCN5_9ACTN|nr:hypothetical protein [Nocardioides deserti]MBC2962098.1 hypothetical protein [Nocardioides deserti]GGO70166.1 hypothetical protein GCM10012276_08090 [Nocardioides deserti]